MSAAACPSPVLLFGVDFSSAPSRRKPIVRAEGQRSGQTVTLRALHQHSSLDDWALSLQQPGPWVGGFDLPFGLPRALVEALGWPTAWPALIAHYAALDRATIRQTFAQFCAARPAGHKFAHRACDGPAGASPSMKWVNPPVAFMLHAGVPRLLAAGLHLPGLHPGDAQRVALEAYPGLLARDSLGRQSYKSDDAARQTPERRAARGRLLAALQSGDNRLGLRLALSPSQANTLLDDGRGDALDAVLCLMQAAWSLDQAHHGLPPDLDPLEGWIVSA